VDGGMVRVEGRAYLDLTHGERGPCACMSDSCVHARHARMHARVCIRVCIRVYVCTCVCLVWIGFPPSPHTHSLTHTAGLGRALQRQSRQRERDLREQRAAHEEAHTALEWVPLWVYGLGFLKP
jgi:hypothetical protein